MQTVQNNHLTTTVQTTTKSDQTSEAGPAPNTVSASASEAEQAGRQYVAGQVVATARAEQEQSSSGERISQAVTDINQYVQNVNRELQFSLEEKLPLGRAVVKVIDSETEEVIREIPSKEVLAIAQRLHDMAEEEAARGGNALEGLIIKAEA